MIAAFALLVTMVLVLGVLWNGLSGMWEIVTKTVGPITIGSPDPKKPHAVIPPWGVMMIVLGIAIFGLIASINITAEDMEEAKKADAKTAAENAKRLEDAEAVLTGKAALEADMEARRAAFEEEMKAERERIRDVVEVEWQRDKKAEIDREYGRYLRYLERDRAEKAPEH